MMMDRMANVAHLRKSIGAGTGMVRHGLVVAEEEWRNKFGAYLKVAAGLNYEETFYGK